METIGDCYVAVTGLPEPQNDHAEIMAKFARSCMFKMLQIVRVLEKHLGPDTGKLPDSSKDRISLALNIWLRIHQVIFPCDLDCIGMFLGDATDGFNGRAPFF